jgi:hypothetical protein
MGREPSRGARWYMNAARCQATRRGRGADPPESGARADARWSGVPHGAPRGRACNSSVSTFQLPRGGVRHSNWRLSVMSMLWWLRGTPISGWKNRRIMVTSYY